MEVTPACYAHFINSLKSYACGRVAVLLEVYLILIRKLIKNIYSYIIVKLFILGWILFEIIS